MTQGLPRTLGEVVEKRIRSMLSNVHTTMAGKVVTFYPATSTQGATADVELGAQHQVFDDDGARTYEDYPVLQAVPVGALRAGGFVVWLPIAVGDYVLVLFNESSIDEWRSSGQKGAPTDSRRHSIGWPICIPMIAPDSAPLAAGDIAARAAGMVIGKDGSSEQIRIASGSIQMGATATDFVALASKVDALFAVIAGVVPVSPGGGSAIIAAVKTYLTTHSTVAATITKAL